MKHLYKARHMDRKKILSHPDIWVENVISRNVWLSPPKQTWRHIARHMVLWFTVTWMYHYKLTLPVFGLMMPR